VSDVDLNAYTGFDWAVLGVLLGALVAGWVRGIVRTIVGLLSFLVAVMLAGRLTGPAVRWLNDTFGFQERLAESLLDRTAVPAGDLLVWSAEGGRLEAVERTAAQAASGVITGITFIVLVMLLTIALHRLGGLFADAIQALPLVGTGDRLLGAVATGLTALLALGVLLIWVIPTLSVYGMTDLAEVVSRSVTPTYIIKAFDWARGLLLGGGLRLWSE
jgi:Colicin V production protein.